MTIGGGRDKDESDVWRSRRIRFINWSSWRLIWLLCAKFSVKQKYEKYCLRCSENSYIANLLQYRAWIPSLYTTGRAPMVQLLHLSFLTVSHAHSHSHSHFTFHISHFTRTATATQHLTLVTNHSLPSPISPNSQFWSRQFHFWSRPRFPILLK